MSFECITTSSCSSNAKTHFYISNFYRNSCSSFLIRRKHGILLVHNYFFIVYSNTFKSFGATVKFLYFKYIEFPEVVLSLTPCQLVYKLPDRLWGLPRSDLKLFTLTNFIHFFSTTYSAFRLFPIA